MAQGKKYVSRFVFAIQASLTFLWGQENKQSVTFGRSEVRFQAPPGSRLEKCKCYISASSFTNL